MKKFFMTLFTFYLIFTTQAHADVNKAMENIQNYFAGMKGIVIDSGGIIDLGSDNKLVPGTVLDVYTEGETIVHPVSGKILGQKQKLIGTLVVDEVSKEFSYVSFKNFKPAVKDPVGFTLPVGVEVVYGEGDNIRETVEYFMAANPIMTAGKDFVINIKSSGGVTFYSVLQKDGKVIFSGSEVRYISKADTTEFFTVESIVDLPTDRFYSLAVGKVYRNNQEKFMVASTEDKVFIFDPKNGYKKVDELKYSYYQVANVEVADLDGDGIDEIFVTHVANGKVADSMIFKHDGTKFVVVQDKIKYMFRSVLDGGKRVIIAQQLLHTGGYKGEIYVFEYKNGQYVAGDALKGTVGRELFGFSYYKDAKNEPVYLNIRSDNHLEIYTFKKSEFVTTEYYGDTINELVASSSNYYAGKPGTSDTPDYDRKLVTISVNPRVEILMGKYPVLVQNDVKSRVFADSIVFNESRLTVNDFKLGSFKKLGQTDSVSPLFTDIFIYEDNGKTYIAALRCNNNWIFQSADPQLIIYRVNTDLLR